MKTLVIIFLKDLLRNKMLGLMVLLVPLIFYPLIYWGITQFMLLRTAFSENTVITVKYHSETSEFDDLKDSLSAINNLIIEPGFFKQANTDNIHLTVQSQQGLPYFEVYVDSSNSSLLNMSAQIEKSLSKYYRSSVYRIVKENDYTPEYFQVYNIEMNDTEGDESVVVILKILSLLVPLFSIMSILGSCVAASVELASGHSEDKTSETTLTLPVERKVIMISKFISVSIYGILAGSLNFIFLTVFMMQIFRSFMGIIDQGIAGIGWSKIISFNTLFFSFVSLCLTAFFISLIFVTAAGFASKRKEGSVLVSPFMAAVTYIPLVIVIPALEPGILISAVPVLNVAFAMKLIISGDINTLFIIQTAIFSFLWTFTAYRYILPFLLDEEVLMGYSDTSLAKKIKGKLFKWKLK